MRGACELGLCILLAGCCLRPATLSGAASPPMDGAPVGVVGVVDRALHAVVCAGTVIRSTAEGTGFAGYVLTAKHCAVDGGVPRQVGVGLPAPGDHLLPFSSRVMDATIAYASTSEEDTHAGTISWVDGDWAILKVHTESPLAIVATFVGEPSIAIKPGERVAIAAHTDVTYIDSGAHRYLLRPHEHVFAWTDVPREVVQGGHSGAPVLWNGEVVAVFVGATLCSPLCRLVSGDEWPTRLRLVSIGSIRREATKQGFLF